MRHIEDVSPRAGLYAIGEVPKSCPGCGSGDSRVTKTRSYTEMGRTVRYRECRRCGHRYTTTTDRP